MTLSDVLQYITWVLPCHYLCLCSSESLQRQLDSKQLLSSLFGFHKEALGSAEVSPGCQADVLDDGQASRLQNWGGPSTWCRLSTWKGAGSMILPLIFFLTNVEKYFNVMNFIINMQKKSPIQKTRLLVKSFVRVQECFYVIWAVSWEGPLAISPDFMRNLRGRTLFGCTPIPCSMSLTQVFHLVIV